MAKLFISDLKDNQNFESVFLVHQKGMPTGKSGKPYISVRLGDKTGEIEGRIWDNAPQYNEVFKASDFVKVKARCQTYQDKLQLSIVDLQHVPDAQVGIEDFLQVTKFDIEKMYVELLALIHAKVDEPDVKRLLLAIFE